METFDANAVLMEDFQNRLAQTHRRLFGDVWPEHTQAILSASSMAMEIIANSDALYHDMQHSMMVTLVGQEILRGKYLLEGSLTSHEWVNFIVSLLCHDIGYVRGICPLDKAGQAVIDTEGQLIEIPEGATDAYLTPYHVERGKMFVRWRFHDHPVIDADAVAANIEYTRFPVPVSGDGRDNAGFPGLVGAADLIGQLADPDYLRKLAFLFFEFEETGATEKLGYKSYEDLRDAYPGFYWKMVNDHLDAALRYLRVTREGRQWEAGLLTHVFSQEHRSVL